MTLEECYHSLEQRRKGLAYKMWKEANLIEAAVNDLFCEKENLFPNTPEEASPELFPKKATIQKPKCLNKHYVTKGGQKYYE